MATFKADMDALSEMVSNLKLSDSSIEDILKSGGYIVTDAVRRSAETIPVRDGKHYNESMKATGIPTYLKNSILMNLGLAKMQKKNGIYDVKIGFKNGYSKMKTKKWASGVPIQMIVRSLEKGNSWMNKYPFVNKAFKSSQKDCVEAMQNELIRQVKGEE